MSEARPRGGQQAEDFRIEHDSMGEVRVPAEAKWRAQTQRAVENFPISGRPIERELIRGLALIKGFGARVRAERGLLDPDKAAAISAVALDVARGDWDAEFPIDVFQTGSGTSSNMNANEVIATLASQRLGGVAVHPNDDVNDPLSSNDQFPSAIHIAATNAVVSSSTCFGSRLQPGSSEGRWMPLTTIVRPCTPIRHSPSRRIRDKD